MSRSPFDVVTWLRDVAVAGSEADRAAMSAELAGLTGREWLRLDEFARGRGYDWYPSAVPSEWLDRLLGPVDVLVAGAASMHPNGHVREAAVRVLGGVPDAIAAAFLSVRVADWVEPVRSRAEAALSVRRGAVDAAVAVPVLLAVARRARGADVAYAYVDAVSSDDALVLSLVESFDRSTALWALAVARDRDLLGEAELMRLVRVSRDQAVVEWCANTVAAEPGGPSVGAAGSLLGSPRSTVRLAGLQHLPDELLPTERVEELLLDGSAMVRQLARWRVRRRGGDPEASYLAALAEPRSPGRRAAALYGLSELDGVGPVDVGLVVEDLVSSSPTVRRAAVTVVGRRGSSGDVVRLLVPRLEDAAPKVATAALRFLRPYASAVPDGVVAALAGSKSSHGRHTALRVHQQRGSWEQVEADLTAMAGEDDALADAARNDLLGWLATRAATTRGRPDAAQAERMAPLLASVELTDRQRREVAFHAGLPDPGRSSSVERIEAAGAVQRTGGWRAWFRPPR